MVRYIIHDITFTVYLMQSYKIHLPHAMTWILWNHPLKLSVSWRYPLSFIPYSGIENFRFSGSICLSTLIIQLEVIYMVMVVTQALVSSAKPWCLVFWRREALINPSCVIEWNEFRSSNEMRFYWNLKNNLWAWNKYFLYFYLISGQ